MLIKKPPFQLGKLYINALYNALKKNQQLSSYINNLYVDVETGTFSFVVETIFTCAMFILITYYAAVMKKTQKLFSMLKMSNWVESTECKER